MVVRADGAGWSVVDAMGASVIQVSQDARGVARVTISSPARMNAMNVAMWLALKTVFDTLAEQPLKAIVLTGDTAGQAFCAGGDIHEYPSFRYDPKTLAHFHEVQVWGGLAAILNCDIPVIAAINGTCMGAGLEMACCADIRVATAGAAFGAPIAKLGFPMAPREAALVTSVLGASLSRQVLLQASILKAETLINNGFLMAVHDPTDFDHAIEEVVERQCRLSPQAARLNKQAMRGAFPALLGLGTTSPTDAYRYAGSAEHREGIEAFIAKRPAAFGGDSSDG